MTLFGLPAHPLVVHAAVVLLPLAALLTVAGSVPELRRRFALLTLAIALVATASVGLAQQSGEELEEQVKETQLVEEHTEQGETVLPWAIAVAAVAAAEAAIPLLRRWRPDLPERTVAVVVVVASLVTAIGATWTVFDVGHSGAKATWSDVGTEDGG